VIEAYRVKGLINRGGDLQIIELSGVWESPNIGVWVFDNELDGTDPQQRVYEAARIALAKFASLDAEELREEAVAGCPFLQGDATQYDPAMLRFSWSAEPTSC
jgi:hypothetical protein